MKRGGKKSESARIGPVEKGLPLSIWFKRKRITRYEAAYLLCGMQPPAKVKAYPLSILDRADDWLGENVTQHLPPSVPGILTSMTEVDTAELRQRVTKEWPLYRSLHGRLEWDAEGGEGRPNAARHNAVRQLVALTSLVHDTLQKWPQTKSGTGLRALMESDTDAPTALGFSDTDTVDRLLAGLVRIYKLGRKSR